MNSVITDSLRGFTVAVDEGGSLQTKLTGTAQVAVADSVATVIPILTLTANRGGLIGTTSDELCSPTVGRQSLHISNNGANAVHIRFGDDDATSDDFLLAAGSRISFERVGPDAVQAIAIGASSNVAVIEWSV